jgi:predicted RNA binding protein YcfA (HicA-like mRNA interferase family)
LLERLASGQPRNVAFEDMARLVEGFGYRLTRTSGSRHIFSHPAIPEMINLQEVKGEAKPYQIRQFLKIVERHDLRLEDEG